MNLLARPSEWTRAGARPAWGTPFAGGPQHYFAFLSYSHRDEAIARWLHGQLEKFRVPMHLVGRITEHGAVPRRLTPIFRDIGELPASGDLGSEIRQALAASQFLIVLCSPDAAISRWTNAEIEAFKKVRPEGCIFAALVAGEPFASDFPGREQDECLPRALRFKYDRRGRPTAKRAEPLCADLREPGEARRLGFLKLVAGLLGVGLDDLVRRDEVRRQRNLAMVTGASLIGMLVATALAATAIQSRDAARDQRREAESLIGFMLGDLREKLEPIGRLDALDGVGSRVLAYYQKQDMAGLSDAALLQRSRALSLMGEVANLRGDLNGATRLYRAAMAGTAEAIRREPNDPQRLFEHAQNVFWTGDIARQRGDHPGLESAYREYKSLAERMVAVEPDNMKWRMELQYADANLGIALYEQRRFPEAARHFQRALATIQALALADPSSREYQKGHAEALAWVADARLASGAIDQAIVLRKRHVALLDSLLKSSGGDVDYREKLIQAYRALGNAHGAAGEPALAVDNLRAATRHADELMAVERENSKWIASAASARLDLARHLLASAQRAEATAQAQAGCRLVEALLNRDASLTEWRAMRRDCLSLQSRLALAAGDRDRALTFANQALDAAVAARGRDPIANAYAVARGYRILGDVRRALGDESGARRAWTAGLARLPGGAAERPTEMNERAMLLERLGRSADARPLRSKLDAMGFRMAA